MNAARPLSPAMLKALQKMAEAPLYRSGDGWMSRDRTFVAHITIRGLRLRGLAVMVDQTFRARPTSKGLAAIGVSSPSI